MDISMKLHYGCVVVDWTKQRPVTTPIHYTCLTKQLQKCEKKSKKYEKKLCKVFNFNVTIGQKPTPKSRKS